MKGLEQLLIYYPLSEDDVIKCAKELIDEKDQKRKQRCSFSLVRMLLELGMSLEGYVYYKMLKLESQKLSELAAKEKMISEVDKMCLEHDLNILELLMAGIFDIDHYGEEFAILKKVTALSENEEVFVAYHDYFSYRKEISTASNLKLNTDSGMDDSSTKRFIELLQKYGTGKYAIDTAYYLDENLELHVSQDYCSIDWEHIYHYELQKEQLYKNTLNFVEGKAFYHSLLVGDSGTGKSSSVKALVRLFEEKNIKLIQLYKGQLKILPSIMKELSKAPYKFIVFLDDLSFEVNEDEYKLLKTSIEGGVSNVAGNIAFYVTTNRRHLIKEVRSEREGDIHLKDFIEEMTSLSKRFGLTLTFPSMVQDEFVDMITKMLEEHDIVIDEEELIMEARRWSLRKGGMSGRSAYQFVKQKL